MFAKVMSKFWSPWAGGIALCLVAGIAKDANMIGTATACGVTGCFILYGLAIQWFVNNFE